MLKKGFLTLFGTGGGDIFIPLSLLNQILSAEFFSKISKFFWRSKIYINRVIWTAQLIESYKSLHLEALKMSIFLAFQHQIGLLKRER
jgi:hypothetical protein